MKKKVSIIILAIFSIIMLECTQSQTIEIKENPKSERIDISVYGEPFTSFCYPSNFEKPFLFPVYAPNGSIITRGYPLTPREGERVDHPHHVGIWFNHGDVNGIDFWNNSSAIKDKEKYGHIVVTRILKATGGKKGEIGYLAEWRDNNENVLLEEETSLIITADEKSRTIDRTTTLKAKSGEVVFTDNKEGLYAIRVDRAFETPSDDPQIYTDKHGNPAEVKVTGDNQGVNGKYYSGSGYQGDDVWSTRNDWVMLSGEKDGSLITFGFFDHPKNIGYPFHSHARGYGLFACNNLGSQSYNSNDEKMSVIIEPDEKITFHHRFYIEAGQKITPEKANEMFLNFSKQY